MRARDNDYRLKLVYDFALPGMSPAVKFGDKRAVDITTGDIELYRHHRREQGVSPVTSNHDLKLLRKMFAWGVRERLIPATPFKVGTESVIALDPETPRERRFASDDDETRLLRAANPHLRGILVAMLDTCCRPGEILSLQWGGGVRDGCQCRPGCTLCCRCAALARMAWTSALRRMSSGTRQASG